MNYFEKTSENRVTNLEKYAGILEELKKYRLTKTEDDPEEQEGWIYDLPKNKERRLAEGDKNYHHFAVRANFATGFLGYLQLLVKEIPNVPANQGKKQQLNDLEQEMEIIYARTDSNGKRTMRTETEMRRVKEIVNESVRLAEDIIVKRAVT